MFSMSSMFSKCHRCLVNIVDVYKQLNFLSFETNGTPYDSAGERLGLGLGSVIAT